MAEGPGNILIKIGAEAGQAISELSSLNSSLGSTMTTSERVGAGLQKAAIPATIALGALADGAVEATKAAIEQEAASDRLAHQLERTTGATDASGFLGRAVLRWATFACDRRFARRARPGARQARDRDP